MEPFLFPQLPAHFPTIAHAWTTHRRRHTHRQGGLSYRDTMTLLCHPVQHAPVVANPPLAFARSRNCSNTDKVKPGASRRAHSPPSEPTQTPQGTHPGGSPTRRLPSAPFWRKQRQRPTGSLRIKPGSNSGPSALFDDPKNLTRRRRTAQLRILKPKFGPITPLLSLCGQFRPYLHPETLFFGRLRVRRPKTPFFVLHDVSLQNAVVPRAGSEACSEVVPLIPKWR